jgi:Kef-type K+ transport system membrane component KefB
MIRICLLAHYFNFSVALGVFLTGSILSRTDITEQVDKITESLRDFFNAVFFISIGMMTDLKAIILFWSWIFALAILTFVGQIYWDNHISIDREKVKLHSKLSFQRHILVNSALLSLH